MSKKPTGRDYADALDELDRMRKAGRVTDGQYEVHRQKLLTEMSAKPVAWPIRVILIVAFVVVVLLAAQVVSGAMQ